MFVSLLLCFSASLLLCFCAFLLFVFLLFPASLSSWLLSLSLFLSPAEINPKTYCMYRDQPYPSSPLRVWFSLIKFSLEICSGTPKHLISLDFDSLRGCPLAPLSPWFLASRFSHSWFVLFLLWDLAWASECLQKKKIESPLARHLVQGKQYHVATTTSLPCELAPATHRIKLHNNYSNYTEQFVALWNTNNEV